MNVAAGIISLLLSIAILFQSCAVYELSSLAESQNNSEAGALGVFVAFLYMVGGAFSFKLPKVAASIMAVSGALAFLGAMGSDFSDLYIWGVLALGIAFMNYQSWRKTQGEYNANQ